MLQRAVIYACALCLLAGAALALPSYRGYTGLMLVPTADALNQGDFNGGLFFEDVASGVVNDYIANYGIIDGLEVGIDRFQFNNDVNADTFINAKYRVLPETDQRPALAVGIIDLTDEEETTAYFVVSKSVSTPVRCWEGEVLNPRIHIGFGGGRLSSVFAGGSAYLGERFMVMAEWDSRDVQAGAKFRITPSLTVDAGFFDIVDRGTFGVGVSFSKYY